ncbi:MAG: hypothetical protein ACFB4J_12395 [Elainellaceae cyanobacterium]
MDYQQLTERLCSEIPDKEMAERVSVEQMFTLIESVLPVEICLHHQILPLFLEGRHLHLGMVYVADNVAFEYARRIIAYLNYSLIKQVIPSKALQTALSAYLKHHAGDAEKRGLERLTAQSSSTSRESPRPTRVKVEARATAAEEPPAPAQPKPTPASASRLASPPIQAPGLSRRDRKPKVIPGAAHPRDRRQDSHKAQQAPDPRLERETYIVDRPETLDEAYLPPEIQLESKSLRPAALSERSVQTTPVQSKSPTSESFDRPPQGRFGQLPTLSLDIRHPELPFERLTELSPKHLLPELLARVLVGNISRLYFEHQRDRGRILWSDDGVLRSAIDPIDKDKLEGVLQELRQIMQTRMTALQNHNDAELEFAYGEATVLLRFRATDGEHGENAMLQILQGATLKFYRRQQIVRLGQDAIDAAKQVQSRVSELKSRMAKLPDSADGQFEVLGDLCRILRSLEQQVSMLQRPDPNS